MDLLDDLLKRIESDEDLHETQKKEQDARVPTEQTLNGAEESSQESPKKSQLEEAQDPMDLIQSILEGDASKTESQITGETPKNESQVKCEALKTESPIEGDVPKAENQVQPEPEVGSPNPEFSRPLENPVPAPNQVAATQGAGPYAQGVPYDGHHFPTAYMPQQSFPVQPPRVVKPRPKIQPFKRAEQVELRWEVSDGYKDLLGEDPLQLGRRNQILQKYKVVRGVGKIKKITGLLVESIGPEVSLGEICTIMGRKGDQIQAEVVGFQEEIVILMPFGEMQGMAPGSKVISTGDSQRIGIGPGILGRIIDPMGRPLDGKGPLQVESFQDVEADPPEPIERPSIEEVLPVGIRAIDSCLTVGKGQRVGVFAGSGVGKSTLMGMIARNTAADVNVIALIGERGREVREFIEKSLGEEGLARSVVVVATSSEPAIVRLKGASVATAIAEYFRDQGSDVMLMMDSVTRFALAQREIGLAIGEPPTTRGYTPSVFSKLPRLFERAGTNPNGTITGFYTVLVEGGDMDEPVADAVRGLLDGHIILDRALAQRNHFPAISVLESVSRLILEIADENHLRSQAKFRDYLATYENSRDLIDIGAYQTGSNPKIDQAIAKIDRLEDFLKQEVHEKIEIAETLSELQALVQ